VIAPREEEFLEFYQAYWPRLVAALAWATPRGEDAEDIAQEAFARAYQHWPVVRTYERPDAWLFVTAYRLASTLRRRLAVRGRRSQFEPRPVHDLFEPSILGELLHTLPQRQRAALLLRHYYGLSTKETAAAMRCPEGTVKSLLQRGLASLRATMVNEEREA
jgi:RNA polymerase sigma-70 factor, ECF subfamily